jgi:hypothetical protein
MKILYLIDPCSNEVDNSYQREIITRLALNSATENDIQVIDRGQLGDSDTVEVMLAQNYDAYFTYNRSGTDINYQSNGVSNNLLSMISKPHVCWLTEHPLCWYAQYFHSQNNRHYILPRLSHANFLKGMDLAGTYTTQLFAADAQFNYKKHVDRKYDLCIAAQWRGSEKANEFWVGRGSTAESFFSTVALTQSSDIAKDTYAAYIHTAKSMNIDISDKLKHSQYMKGLYWHARKKERIELVQSFVNSGLKIALIGSDEWKSVLGDVSNVEFYDNCDHANLLDIYADSRAVLNVNAANGVCERAFDAASVGAMIVSEYSPEIERIFGSADSVVMYNPTLASTSINLICELVQSNASEILGNNAYNCLVNGHTWDHRAKWLNTIFKSYT